MRLFLFFISVYLSAAGMILYAAAPDPEHQKCAAAYLDLTPVPILQFWSGKPDEETTLLTNWLSKHLPEGTAKERASQIAENFMRRTGWNGIRAQGMTLSRAGDQAYCLKRICYTLKYKQIGIGWELFDRLPRHLKPMMRAIPPDAAVAFGTDINGPGLRDFLFSFIADCAPEFLPALQKQLALGLAYGYDWSGIFGEVMSITGYLERTPGKEKLFGNYTGGTILIEMNTPVLFDALADQFQQGLQQTQMEEKLKKELLQEAKIKEARLNQTKQAMAEEKRRMMENRKKLESLKKKKKGQQQPVIPGGDDRKEDAAVVAEFDFAAVEEKLLQAKERPEADVIQIPDSPFYFGWKNGCFFLTTTDPDVLFSRIDSESKKTLMSTKTVQEAQKFIPAEANGFFYLAEPELYGVVSRCPDGYFAAAYSPGEKQLADLAVKGFPVLRQLLDIPFDANKVRAFFYRKKKNPESDPAAGAK